MNFEEVKKLIFDSYNNLESYDFLFGSAIRECEQIIAKSKCRLDKFTINEVELLSLILLERNAYEFLQNGVLHSDKTYFQQIWEENMDSLLKKIPVTHKKVIYRNDQYCDVENLKILYKEQKQFKVNHYLTCSKEFLPIGRFKAKLIIHPLKRGSKAHNVYMLYNFGRNKEGTKPEWQIEFEREAEFRINSINQKGGYYVIHLIEQPIN